MKAKHCILIACIVLTGCSQSSPQKIEIKTAALQHNMAAPLPRVTPRVTLPAITVTARPLPTAKGTRTPVATGRSLPTVNVTRTPVATTRAGNSTEALQVIQTYASNELGINVKVLSAGSTTNPNLTLSSQGKSSVEAAAQLAVQTYGGVLSNGGASVSYGSGTVSGDIAAELESCSLGAYSLLLTTQPPADATAALALVKTTYPALSAFAFQVLSSTATSYSFYATSSDSVLNPKTHKVETVAVVAMAGTIKSGRKLSVYVVLGRGQLATAVARP
ncbi:MAG: hypothetical protein M1546_21195 [Chloroflexi bacterium]|nr:hypothetical protein [Chloroflexota bacterium]